MKIKAIAACGNGMGSSQMIKMKINKVFKRLGDLDKFSKWEENWELKNTQLGFEIGDYLKCNPASFEGYPPLINE